jgi:hypothetical protein
LAHRDGCLIQTSCQQLAEERNILEHRQIDANDPKLTNWRVVEFRLSAHCGLLYRSAIVHITLQNLGLA